MEMENFTILPLGSLFAWRDRAMKLMTGPHGPHGAVVRLKWVTTRSMPRMIWTGNNHAVWVTVIL